MIDFLQEMDSLNPNPPSSPFSKGGLNFPLFEKEGEWGDF
jgi:hypothetical protein